MRAGQNPGDKSTELSVRTQDLLEEASHDDAEDEDDDLSEQMSYDDHDTSGYDDTTNDGHASENGDGGSDVDLGLFEDGEIFGDEDAAEVSDDESIQQEDQSVASQDSTVRDIDAAPRSQVSAANEEEEEAPRDYRGNGAYGTLHDLIEVYGERNQISFSQYERSLRQLHAKWETVLEHSIFEHEQNFDSVERERQEMESHIQELRRAHANELEASKASVMEQSQKIILEEMKLNAHHELVACKSSEAVEAAIEEAVEETRREMSEDFEIALEGTKTAQEEMKARYEKLVKDTEVRVRDEVETNIERKYVAKIETFQETYEDLKSQLVDQTMQIQTLEMNAGPNKEAFELISKLEDEVKAYQTTTQETKICHKEQIAHLQSEKKALFDASAASIDQDTLAKAVEAAKTEVRNDMTDEFDIVLSGMKKAQTELSSRYAKLVKETEIRVRDEGADAKKEADRTAQAIQQQYDEVKAQVIDLYMQVEKLDSENSTKDDEISQLGVSLETSEHKVVELTTEVTSNISKIEKLESAVESKSSIIIQLGAELEAKISQHSTIIETKEALISNLKSTSEEYELRLQNLNNEKDEEIQRLNGNVALKLTLISQLETSAKEKNGEMKNLEDSIESMKAANGSETAELANRAELLEAEIQKKDAEALSQTVKIEKLETSMKEKNGEMKNLEDSIESMKATSGSETAELANRAELVEAEKLKKDAEAFSQTVKIDQLETSMKEREGQMKKLKDSIESTKATSGSETAELANRAELVEAEKLKKDAEAFSQTVKIDQLETSMKEREGQMKKLKDSIESTKATSGSETADLVNRAELLEAEIQKKDAEALSQTEKIDQLETSMKEREGEMKTLEDTIESMKATNGSETAELANRSELLEAEMQKKDADALSQIEKFEQLGEEILLLNKAVKKKDKLLQKNMAQKNTHIDELNVELEAKNEGIKELLNEMDSIGGNIEGLSADLGEKNELLETNAVLIKNLQKLVAEKEGVLVTNEEEIATLAEQITDLKERKGTNRAEVEKIEFDCEMKVQDVIDEHQDEMEELEVKVTELKVLLAQKEIQYQSSISELELKIKEQHKSEAEALKSSQAVDEELKIIEEKYNLEIHNLHKSAEEEKARSEAIVTGHEEKLEDAEVRFNEEIDSLKKNHQMEMAKLTNRHMKEIEESEKIANLVQQEKESHLKEIAALTRDQQEPTVSFDLHDSKSIQSENQSTSSSKRRAKRKIAPSEAPQSETITEQLPADPPFRRSDPAAVMLSPSNTLEDISEGKETPPGNVQTPEKVPFTKEEDVLVSPLTMTSPLAKVKKTNSMSRSTASLSRTPKRIPRTVETNARRAHSDRSGLDTGRSVRTLPARTSRSMRSTPSTPKTNSPAKSRPRESPITAHTISSRLRAAASPKRPSSSVTGSVTKSVRSTLKSGRKSSKKESSKSSSRSSSSSNRHGPTPPRVHHSDLESIQMQSREGLFPCEAPLPHFGEIKLIILNVPFTDERKKMAKALNIEIVNDPLTCTHAIVGDADNHIRRTAKLMAVLCITPYIMSSTWLDDCYKHRLIMGPSHHMLLNDYIAEKAYCFSMKKTVRDGNERRKEGGILNGWKIMLCSDVAGKKAPKESDLKMMVAASGGQWLESSNVPVPLEEDPIHVIVITSDPATLNQLEDEMARTAAENGAGFFTTGWLFDILMHQKISGIRRGRKSRAEV